ncbi:peptidase M23 [Alphaproteobacteria bacterium]|nr:peptidase M23 [Alphaproteobacteria bacterium]
MRVLCVLFASLFFLHDACFCQQSSAKKASVECKRELKELCKKAFELEQKILKEEEVLDCINQEERTSAPVVKNKYEILARCLTLLCDIQRSSKILTINPDEKINDFVRCSIVIKNFASYFKSIGGQLGKAGSEVVALKREKNIKKKRLQELIDEYEKLVKKIDEKAAEIAKSRPENVIQSDVVYHIASKSESIEELDAELEAENAIGVLKNTRISTELSLDYPVCGKIVTEFGDKNPDGEMICYISFETRPGAIVRSPAKGCVVFAGKFLGYGNMVIISNGDYRVFVYGMDTIATSIGEFLEIGDYIGKMNASPLSNPVLKMELKKTGESLDPRHWMLQTIEKGKK